MTNLLTFSAESSSWDHIACPLNLAMQLVLRDQPPRRRNNQRLWLYPRRLLGRKLEDFDLVPTHPHSHSEKIQGKRPAMPARGRIALSAAAPNRVPSLSPATA